MATKTIKGIKSAAASRVDTKKLATMAMLTALAYVVMAAIHLPLMAAAPFLKYDPKDVVLTIGAFIYGPVAGLSMSFVVCFLEMITVSEDPLWGFLMNVVASAAFILPASVLYHRRRTMRGAITGLGLSVISMTLVMLLWNFLITPLYMKAPRDMVLGMLLPVILPFNLIKSVLNASLILVLYQPVTNILHRTHLLPALPDGSLRRSYNLSAVLLGLFLLATGVLVAMVLTGTI